MKKANLAELKNNLSKLFLLVEQGEEIEICKRNVPIAHIVPLDLKERKNNTQLGVGKGSAEVMGDLTQPMIPVEDWDMLK